MKICIFGDVHWSKYSSIIRDRGIRFSKRLENLIQSVNFVEETAIKYNCDRIIGLGDFFDSTILSSEEITALKEIRFSNIQHDFLCGNHETNSSDNFNSTVNLFNLANFSVNDVITTEYYDKFNIVFVPYLSNIKESTNILNYIDNSKFNIIFSHNDIAGIQYGKYLSKTGFSIDSINSTKCLFINGHLHNYGITGNLINLGNLTGQNFNEDALQYPHFIMILNTDTYQYEFVENPYAYNFYKLDFKNLQKLKANNELKNQAVISLRVFNNEYNNAKILLNSTDKIVESRIIVEVLTDVANTTKTTQNLTIDHIQQFKDFVLKTYPNSEYLVDELNEVCK